MKNAAKIAIISLVLASCQNVKDVSDIPFVRFESYELVEANVDDNLPSEHIIVKFYFRDGDGNIGLDSTQKAPPFCDTCDHYYNLFVGMNSKLDGVFEKTYDYNSRIGDITPNGQNPVLEGHVIYKIDIANRASDTIMIDFYLEDRALNKSNVDMTPEVYVDL